MLHEDFHIFVPHAEIDEVTMLFSSEHTFSAFLAMVGPGSFDDLAGLAE